MRREPRPAPRRRCASGPLALFGAHRIVDHYAVRRIDRRAPRRTLDHPPGIGVALAPPFTDPGRREVDVLRMILAVELRGNQARDVHGRSAPPRRELLRFRRVAGLLRQLLRELADDVAQMVDLLLPRDMACRPAR